MTSPHAGSGAIGTQICENAYSCPVGAKQKNLAPGEYPCLHSVEHVFQLNCTEKCLEDAGIKGSRCKHFPGSTV